MDKSSLALRRLPLGARLSLTFLMLVLLGGYLASGLHMQEHHHNRDGRPEMSMADIEGVYHGVTTPSRLRELLLLGHPGDIEGAEPPNPDDVSELLAWLEGDAVAENWSNIDFGEGFGSPEELTAATCGACHGAQVASNERAEPLLATWDHYKEFAFENSVSPTDEAILLASTHTHAISLATVTLLVCMLMHISRFSRKQKGILEVLASGGLFLDLACWWLARDTALFVPLIVVGGVAHAGAMGLMMLAVIVDVWAPEPGG